MHSVLLGDRPQQRTLPSALKLVARWLPVAIMLAVIARESTEGFSGIQTSPILRPVWEHLFGVTSDAHWAVIHHVLRKCGHFAGYGTLGLTWLRAWLLQWSVPLRRCSVRAWQRYGLQMAICCTAIVASLDELHQTYLPDRTGVTQDVLLDTCGAIVFCGGVLIAGRILRSERS